ncbi:EF-P lysine aminoacylase EpmA [Roseibacterium sp. SDUM158016]|uniref:EF-P lysine aminoacylase EpmA n=1 Tax=Roseicyclus sediminis TaxID=2980997 RepID=UPI0021D0C002|nr:EF-P lysine aminoacylase EpmA [Roseibacterium sp. SDUM158016]MCU4651613.1 EF-P lysine aminoacylase EpmA [Roseibacterium sp. SDUM158016]
MTWWDKATHADRRPLLLARNRIIAALRAWFAAEGFVEVDPAYVVASPGNEAHLHALETAVTDDTLTTRRRYLHTSPEFAMKKLLAAGEERIFSFARVWRDREGGPRHAAEFTMLEWYRADEGYETLMEDCATILRIAAEAAGVTEFRHRDLSCDPFAPLRRTSVGTEFARHGIDLLATLPGGAPDTAALAAQLPAAGIPTASDDSWSDLFSRALTGLVEPALGPGPVILDAYPAPEAALARRQPADPRLAERFELFACGVELANAFGELTDPAEQRARFEADMDLKERLYGTRYPLDEDFLAALAHMPPASGCALGFDRLVMLATHAPRVADVMWTPPA